MIPNYLNLNFWSFYFHNSINSLLSCLIQLCHILQILPKTSKVQCVAFAGHAPFYMKIIWWDWDFCLTYILTVYYETSKFVLKTSSSLIIFNCIIYLSWFLILFLFCSLWTQDTVWNAPLLGKNCLIACYKI